MAAIAVSEIKALAKIIGDLNYYEILGVTPSASSDDIKNAYYEASRKYRPISYPGAEETTRLALEEISKRVTESYTVLRNGRRREAYDEMLKSGDRVRMQLVDAQAAAGKKASEEREGKTPNGKRYYALCKADLQRQDYAAALRNLKTALTFEPANESFKEQIEELKKKVAATAPKSHGYEIR